MKKLRFTKIEKRIIIILMLINCFALFVNVFDLDVKEVERKNMKSFYPTQNYNSLLSDYTNVNIDYYFTDGNNRNKSDFYPFVKFNSNKWRLIGYNYEGGSVIKVIYTFRGIFPDYDYSEFFVYTLIIFGVPLLIKLW